MNAPLKLNLTPEQAVRAWPADWRLAALWSGGGNARSRWTLLARPTGEAIQSPDGSGTRWPTLLERPVEQFEVGEAREDAPLFTSGWLGMVSYEFGRTLEPKVARTAQRGGDWPMTHWQRFEDALAFDHRTKQWWAIGRGAAELADAIRGASPRTAGFNLSPLQSRTGRKAFEQMVATAIDHIRSGDIYQVNVTHAVAGLFSGSSREFFLPLAASATPWYGAYLELEAGRERIAIASASPELFLSFDPRGRRVETRPMKGTRLVVGHGPGTSASSNDEAARASLAHSEKDQAELAMIVDLMRNDLGRVCEARSIRVEDVRAMERHASLFQTTATVSGTLPPHRSLRDLLEATFPGGSITGVPKIRAMQIIEELERAPRGPYCGSIGYVGDNGSLLLNIAIRTAAIRGLPGSDPSIDSFTNATLDYGVGAGIVADSIPSEEWKETLAKAEVIARVVNRASACATPSK